MAPKRRICHCLARELQVEAGPEVRVLWCAACAAKELLSSRPESGYSRGLWNEPVLIFGEERISVSACEQQKPPECVRKDTGAAHGKPALELEWAALLRAVENEEFDAETQEW